MGTKEVTQAILARAKRDEKFRSELIDSLEERLKKCKEQIVVLTKTIRVVKKLSK